MLDKYTFQTQRWLSIRNNRFRLKGGRPTNHIYSLFSRHRLQVSSSVLRVDLASLQSKMNVDPRVSRVRRMSNRHTIVLFCNLCVSSTFISWSEVV